MKFARTKNGLIVPADLGLTRATPEELRRNFPPDRHRDERRYRDYCDRRRRERRWRPELAFSLVSTVSAGSAAGAAITTGAIDTTGANLIVVAISDLNTDTTTLTDSKGNTWTGLTLQTVSNFDVRLFYCSSPTVGSGHTFTATPTVLSYAAICVAAFSGAASSSPFDVQSGTTSASATTLASGSISPSVNGELVISALGVNAAITSVSVDSSLSIIETVAYSAGAHFSCRLAYYVQPTAGAINPTWSWTTASPCIAVAASFKAASGTVVPQIMNSNRQRCA